MDWKCSPPATASGLDRMANALEDGPQQYASPPRTSPHVLRPPTLMDSKRNAVSTGLGAGTRLVLELTPRVKGSPPQQYVLPPVESAHACEPRLSERKTESAPVRARLTRMGTSQHGVGPLLGPPPHCAEGPAPSR